jgi:sortase A
MQSSSAARAVVLAATIATTLVYFPNYLTPDAIAQSVGAQTPLPSPEFTTLIATTPLQQSEPAIPTPPKQPSIATNTATTITKAVSASVASTGNTSLEQLVIPSINLDDPIVPVGVDSTGAMAVPNGKTDEVGWWDGGPQPGDVGSAVLDAHIFAAFKNLNEVQVGDSIYVTENGQSFHFVVTAVKLYALSDITSQDLFVQTSDRDLNLITCAGKLTPDRSTYDHRLVVYSTLVS